MDTEKRLKELVKGDILFLDLFIEEKAYTHIHRESFKFERIEKAEDSGSAIRVVTPWRQFLLSTNSRDLKELLSMARDLTRETPNYEKIHVVKTNYPFQVEKRGEEFPLTEKIRLVENLERLTRGMDERIKQIRIILRDSVQRVKIFTSNGLAKEDERHQIILNLLVVGEKDGDIQTSYESIGGFKGYEFLSMEILEELANKVTRRLKGLLEAREAPMGRMTVVLGSQAGGTMIHEAIGHGLEADLALEGLSCYKDKLGLRIASPLITIVDDKTLPQMRGTYAIDDEGTEAQRTILVEKGILKSYMFDRFYALKYNFESTANGRRESFRHKVIPRMSNTYILPGESNPEDIIRSVDKGLYVAKMGGGQVDTVTGEFVFEVGEGYLIEGGRIGDMVKNATLLGSGPKVLMEIDMVGWDLGFSIGTCGKDGQGVPVSDGQPTLRIPELIVGGRARG